MLNGFSNTHHLTASQFEYLKGTNPEDNYFVSSVAVAGTKKEVIPATVNVTTKYTAPADGYIQVSGTTTSGGYYYINNTSTGLIININSQSGGFYNHMRVAKGDVVTLFQNNGTIKEYAFYYDK